MPVNRIQKRDDRRPARILKSKSSVKGPMLRLLSILFIVPYVFGDCAYHWGDYAFKECRTALRACPHKESVPRGVCDNFQEALEAYVEATGNQLAEAMGVSFSELCARLQVMPFKTVGESGIRSTIEMALEKRTKEVTDISNHIGTWGSAWILKASADDKQGMGGGGGGGMPAGMSMEDLEKQIEEKKMEQQMEEFKAKMDVMKEQREAQDATNVEL